VNPTPGQMVGRRNFPATIAANEALRISEIVQIP
jgi:hypothetical protein